MCYQPILTRHLPATSLVSLAIHCLCFAHMDCYIPYRSYLATSVNAKMLQHGPDPDFCIKGSLDQLDTLRSLHEICKISCPILECRSAKLYGLRHWLDNFLTGVIVNTFQDWQCNMYIATTRPITCSSKLENDFFHKNLLGQSAIRD